MRHLFKGIAIASVLTVVLASCNPFIFKANNLKGQTVVYYVDFLSMTGFGAAVDNTFGVTNGHDNTSFTFDSTGKAGTFATARYTFGLATQAAVTSNKYTDKTWFQNNGLSGSFTYDPDKSMLVLTPTRAYAPNPTATPMTNAQIAAADYSYQDLKTVDGYDAESGSTTATVQLTQDGMNMVYVAGSAANTWVATSGSTQSITVGSVTTTDTVTTTETMTVVDGTITDDLVSTDVYNDGTTTTTTHTQSTNTYSIFKTFISGKDTKDMTFASMWKKGNTVSFEGQQTGNVQIKYTGATAPAAPTVDPTTGTGLTGTFGTPPYYLINNVPSSSPQGFDLANMGSYVMQALASTGAVRTLK
jgi:hypothetical protein